MFAGDFRVIRRLSEGGMGAVYVVEQVSTGKQRALKIMHPNLVHDESLRQRFVLEARVGARIESDHVIDVVAAGIDADTEMPWLAMELLTGETLADRVETMGARHLAEVREVMAQLCHALGAAHKVGIVHRDLKPENIFLAVPRREGTPFVLKVLDFGIAKLMAEADTRQTSSMGSPLWMAPEQADIGATITPAIDVWPLGLLAYWMLTGKEYWRGAHAEYPSAVQLLAELKFQPLEKASERAARYGVDQLIPNGFDEWFSRCVARELEDRYTDAYKTRAAFEELVAGGKPTSSTSSTSTKAQPSIGHDPTLPASSLAIPDLDLAPRSPSQKRPAVNAPIISAPASAPTTAQARTASSPRMAAVSAPIAQGPARTASSPRLAAVKAPLASPKITELDAEPEFERSSSPMQSQPSPARSSQVSPQPVARPAHVQTSPKVSVARTLRNDDEPRGLSPIVKYGALGVVAVIALYFGLRVVLSAAEHATKKDAADPQKQASSSVTPPSTAPTSCPKEMILMSGGTIEVPGSAARTIDSFCIDRTEVTVKDYAACVKSKQCSAASPKGNWSASSTEQQKVYNQSCNGGDKVNHPVNCVDWSQATAFCDSLGKQLPTEAQWEWAARGRTERWPFPWGKEPPDNHLCWSQFGKRAGTCVVGSYARGDSPWGVQDLDGNVREWMRGEPADTTREYCGSDWTDTKESFHSLGYCLTAPSNANSGFIGFRCVKG